MQTFLSESLSWADNPKSKSKVTPNKDLDESIMSTSENQKEQEFSKSIKKIIIVRL